MDVQFAIESNITNQSYKIIFIQYGYSVLKENIYKLAF